MAAGRKRAFDEGIALDSAIKVFWKNGYSGSSLSELTAAMAINKPSLYATFGNKEKLFMRALDQYVSEYSFAFFDKLFTADQSLEERLKAYLHSMASMLSDPNLPSGCLLANSTSESAGDGIPPEAHKMILDFFTKTKEFMTAFFTQEQAQGNISSQSTPASLALFFMSLSGGMAVLARTGANLSEMDEMIEHVVSKTL